MPFFDSSYLRFLLLRKDSGPSSDSKLLPNGQNLSAEEPLPELGKSPLLHLAHVGVEETVFIIIDDLTEAAAASPAPPGTSGGETGVSDKVNCLENIGGLILY